MEKIKSKLILISCIALFSLTGCLQKNIIDDVQLIQGTVFDTAKDNKVKVTFVCPIQKKGNKVQVFEGTANAVKQVKADTSLESSQPFASGQMRVALYTIRLAKKRNVYFIRYITSRCEYRERFICSFIRWEWY